MSISLENVQNVAVIVKSKFHIFLMLILTIVFFRWVATPGPTPQEEAKAEQERQMELKVSSHICIGYPLS